ncbi:MAG: hypothetical protein ACOVO1_09675 [Chitinophagaceae bacterium]
MKPAEDALDAAREFKNSCLKGDFDRAKFYLIANEKNNINLEDVVKLYNSKDAEQQKELKEASIIITSNKEIAPSKFEIVLSNSYDKIADTISVIKENNFWLVDLTK